MVGVSFLVRMSMLWWPGCAAPLVGGPIPGAGPIVVAPASSTSRFSLRGASAHPRRLCPCPPRLAHPGRFARELPMTEAVDGVVVHHSRRLHERVTDGGAHEAKAALLQVLAHGIGLGRRRGDLAMAAVSLKWRTSNEAPDESIERTFLANDAQERGSVRDRALDLEPVPNDAGV